MYGSKYHCYAFDAATNSQMAKSMECMDVPFTRAYGLPAMQWITTLGNKKVSVRNANVMKAQESMQPCKVVLIGDPSDPGLHYVCTDNG